MKRSLITARAAPAALAPHGTTSAQAADPITVGVQVTQPQGVASGCSAERQILGQIVYNEEGEQVGNIVGAGGCATGSSCGQARPRP